MGIGLGLQVAAVDRLPGGVPDYLRPQQVPGRAGNRGPAELDRVRARIPRAHPHRRQRRRRRRLCLPRCLGRCRRIVRRRRGRAGLGHGGGREVRPGAQLLAVAVDRVQRVFVGHAGREAAVGIGLGLQVAAVDRLPGGVPDYLRPQQVPGRAGNRGPAELDRVRPRIARALIRTAASVGVGAVSVCPAVWVAVGV